MTKHTYDLIVIGTGTAANVTAMGCRKAGWSVAVVDHRPFGGTCALRGCDPKKMLIAATEVVDGFERMGGIGTVQGEVRIDWAALQRHKRSFTDPVPGKREEAYAKQGIQAFHGRARFTGLNRPGCGRCRCSAAIAQRNEPRVELTYHRESTSCRKVGSRGHRYPQSDPEAT